MDEPEFKITQEVVMTPYAELHSGVDLVAERKFKGTDFSHYYLKSEDVPFADRNLNFGENFLPGAMPNWSFQPPSPEAEYEDANRVGTVSRLTAKLDGSPGGPPELYAVLPDISYEFEISMDRRTINGIPYIHVTVAPEHNLYPAYEALVQQSTNAYSFLYQNMPASSTLPGPYSLNTSMTGADVFPADVQ